QLDASVGASGPHGFAVRINTARLALPTRPPHPASTFVTIASAPLNRGGTAQANTISDFQKEKYFTRWDWTTRLSLNRLMKSPFTRTPFFMPWTGERSEPRTKLN